MTDPTAAEWLGLCLSTESDRESEWPAVAAVILNRVRSSRYPSTVRDVVLQPMQFSYFNPYTKAKLAPRAIWAAVARDKGAYLLTVRACVWATLGLDLEIPTDPEWTAGVSPDTMHYYSPVSMRPRGSAPKWASAAVRLYTPEGIDPDRFVFAEGVP